MRQEIKKRRRKPRKWKFPTLTDLKTKAWILAGALVISVAILATIGPKVVELDRYLDRQLERMSARK